MLINTEDNYFSSHSPTERGHFAGISYDVGHDMAFKILNSFTNKITNRSNAVSANDGESPSLQFNPITSTEAIKSLREDKFKSEDYDSKKTAEDNSSTSPSARPVPTVDPKNLVGRTFFIYLKK